MDRQIRKWFVATVFLAVLGGVVPVQAEVSSQVDGEGNYVRMVVLPNVLHLQPGIWSVQKPRPDFVPLNEHGDRNGDQWPVILENPQNGNWPWVIWPRFNGLDYDLAFSRWMHGGWTDIRWVEESPATVGDDFDPDGTLDVYGRPYVVWWRDENGKGQVYLSVYLATRWMTAYPVSDEYEDARYPVVYAGVDGNIHVQYDTPNGPVSRTVWFSRPGTITDELNPFDTMKMDYDATQDYGMTD